MKTSFAIAASLIGLALAHPAAELNSIAQRAENDALAPLIAELKLEGADADAIAGIVAGLKMPTNDELAAAAALEARDADLEARAIIDPNCAKCIKKICSKAAACLRLPAPGIVPCLLGFCAAGSAICCAFT